MISSRLYTKALPVVGGRGSRWLAALFLLLVVALAASQAPELIKKADAQAAGTSLNVTDLKTGGPIANFKYTINEDNVGDPTDPAQMPSLRPSVSNSPVAATGDDTSAANIDLPDGKYLVSVLADGYKIGGEHFTAPGGEVTVLLEKDPLPLAKIRVHAFADNRILNGEDDAPLEPGLAGFDVIIKDEVGEVSQDYFGNPLGTEYEKNADGSIILDADGNPTAIPDTGGKILTDANGDAVVENLAPGKYGIQIVEPDGSGWIQTSTLEGTHTIDAWIDEGNDGYIGEGAFAGVAGPQSPMADIGFVKEQNFANPGTGSIKGTARTTLEFVTETANPPLGDPVPKPYIGLTALDQNDELSYMGRGNADGTFDIPNVPEGTYQLVTWDENMDSIISFQTVIVNDGQSVDVGNVPVPRWFGHLQGHVFMDNGLDANGNQISPDAAGNSIRDCTDPTDQTTCEKGVPNTDLDTRYKDDSIQYATLSKGDGSYSFDETFPLGAFTVGEVGFGRLGITGASVLSEYDGKTVKSTHDGALTLSEFAVSGGKNYIDWGKKNYTGTENGGITGIVRYAAVRNEQNARYASAEDFEPGLPGVTVNLYKTVDADNDGQPDADPQSGALVRGDLVNTTKTDSWQHPSGCDVLDENGDPFPYPPGSDGSRIGPECTQVLALGAETRDGVFDGGYAFFTDSAGNALPPDKYIVEAQSPKDNQGNDLYKIEKEEDVNVDKGSNFVPQIPPPSCAGPNHLVQDTRNPYDSQQMPLCDSKVVQLNARQNAAADFFYFTDAPVPGRVVGLVTDDLNIETDPNLVLYGDKKGLANLPIGIRDHNGRLITTVRTDKNGIFEVLLPSTETYNIPTPSGVAPGMYHFVANDPGDPSNPNADYDPNYQVLDLIYDVWPGKTTAADLAIIQRSDAEVADGQALAVPAGVPQVMGLNRPLVTPKARDLAIKGQDFGAKPQVTLGGKAITVKSVTPDGKQITVSVPKGFPVGPKELLVKSGGKTSQTGLTVHVTGTSGGTKGTPGKTIKQKKCKTVKVEDRTIRVKGRTFHIKGKTVKVNGKTFQVKGKTVRIDGKTIKVTVKKKPVKKCKVVPHRVPPKPPTKPAVYTPRIVQVKQGQSIQNAIDKANPGTLILVGPGAYKENLVLHKGVKLQGSGAGVTTIDGAFRQANQAAWTRTVAGIKFAGRKPVPQGAAITVLADANEFKSGFRPSIDGFTIKGAQGGVGGGIFVNAYGNYLDVMNNEIRANGGHFGGAIVIGRPYSGSNHNQNVRISYNRVIGNGGQKAAGAIGLYSGASNYLVSRNVICGNYSAEYGGGISHYGYSPGGKILHNDICYNKAFDEGGGILVGGELVKDPAKLSIGSGPVTIDANNVRGNVSNDDGGGIRLLDVEKNRVSITNNMVTNNTATDMGGGIALDDAPFTTVVNNTIAKNLTTGTAEDRIGAPRGAGLAGEKNSRILNQALPAGSSDYSNPVLFNNILWDNLAGRWNGSKIVGAGQPGDATPKNVMDLQVYGTGQARYFRPVYSLLTVKYGGSPNNKVGLDPAFAASGDTVLDTLSMRGDPHFVSVSVTRPSSPTNYHIKGNSPAVNAGVAASGKVTSPKLDFDGQKRPNGSKPDIGADEYIGGPR